MKIDIPIFTIDFEGSKELGVVEYGIAEIVGGEVVRTQTGLCAPRKTPTAFDKKALDIAEISLATLDGLPKFDSKISAFKNMRRKGLLAAHNAAFEDSIMRSYIPSAGEVPDFVEANRNVYTWGPWLDSFVFVKNIYPTLPSAKLGEAIDALGFRQTLDTLAATHCPEERRKWHCALYDALASATLFTGICSQSGFENASLPWIAKYSGSPQSDQTTLF